MTLTFDALGTGRTVLFLHGAFTNRRVFGYQLLDLSRQFRVVTPDLPGYGASPWDPSVAWLDQAAEGIGSLAEELDMDEPVVVGWSLGGIVAARVVAKLGRGRLVLVGVSGRALDQSVRETMANRLRGDFPRYARTMVRAFTSSSVSPETEDWLFGMAVSSGPDVCIGSLLAHGDTPMDPLPEHTVTIGGARDQVVPPSARIRASASDFDFESSGHAPFLEERQRFNELIAELAR